MTPDRATTFVRLAEALTKLFDLWQRMPAGTDAEQAKQFDRLSKLLDAELDAAEKPQ